MRASVLLQCCVLGVGVGLAAVSACLGQAPASPPAAEGKLPEIADEPRAVDPAALMPEKLAVKATADFSNATLSDIVAWLQTQQKLTVILKKNVLAEANVLPSEPVSDRLNDEPIYLMLNRLRLLGLAWYYENGIVYITSTDDAEGRLTTVSYNLGSLLDAGYTVDGLCDTITGTIGPETWDAVGGTGVLNVIGDVMFVSQTDAVQRTIQGFLTALPKHARQTLVNDPIQHLAIRKKLEENVSVAFREKPLDAAIAELAALSGVDIRLDLPALEDSGIRPREPITVELADCKLKTVLEALAMNLELAWVLRDGVLWITNAEAFDAFLKVAVYDVRDLCRDAEESGALKEAITSQTEPGSWDDVGGAGSMAFAKPGTMVVSNKERILESVLELLETYRAALRASKPRPRQVKDPKEVLTVYYRMHAAMADDLAGMLPFLVEPESWQLTDRDMLGRIVRVASAPEPTVVSQGQGEKASTTVSEPRAVLIVTQTRAAHEKIAEVIRRVESGDPSIDGDGSGGMGGMGMGGGMGGFGGGFFSIPRERNLERER